MNSLRRQILKLVSILMIFEIFFVMSSVYISNRFEREAQNDALRNSMQKTFELTYSQILGALILNDTILTQSILDNLSSRDGMRAVLTDSNGLSLEAGLQEGSNLAWHNYSISHAGKTYGNLALGRPTLESFSNLKSFLLLFAMSQIFLLILSTLLLLRWSLENIERPLKEILKFENSAGQSYGNLDLMQKRLPEELKNAAQLFLLNWQQRNVNNTNAAIAKTTQMLAHDVRKPFSMVTMLLDSIQDAESASEIKEISRDFLPTIRSAISSVSGMLQDIMEVGSDTKITPEDSDPTCLIESALNDVFRIHLDAKIRISYELLHTHKASIDTLKVQRVFCNIVSNAVQAIKSNGELWFRTREIFSESGEMLVEICIGNSGSFISSESVSKVFDAFFTENKRGGTGLGLAIAQKMVHAHGGKIWCVSEVSSLFPEGMVEFLFTLPVSKTLCNVYQNELPENSKAISDFLRVFSDKETFDDSSEDRLLLSERLISIFFRTYSRKIKILIVDDEALYRNALRSMLQKSTEIPTSPFSIFCAASPNDAMEIFRDETPDICILDIDLKTVDKTGFDLLTSMRNLYQNAMICIHSNRISTTFQKQAFELGAHSFLPKPMSRAHLFCFIAEVLPLIRLELLSEGKKLST